MGQTKKRILAWILALGALFLAPLFGANSQGSDGGQISGGGCGHLELPVSEADSDQDGVADSLDNCPAAFNPHQTDLDGNGIGEICEVVEPFDGQLECEFPSCSSDTECSEFLAQSCPEDNIEASFLGLNVDCCDQACVVIENPEEGSCPVGSCPEPFVHCVSDTDCQEIGFQACFQGCCLGEAPPPESPPPPPESPPPPPLPPPSPPM